MFGSGAVDGWWRMMVYQDVEGEWREWMFGFSGRCALFSLFVG
jgi:hypothetical protein